MVSPISMMMSDSIGYKKATGFDLRDIDLLFIHRFFNISKYFKIQRSCSVKRYANEFVSKEIMIAYRLLI